MRLFVGFILSLSCLFVWAQSHTEKSNSYEKWIAQKFSVGSVSAEEDVDLDGDGRAEKIMLMGPNQNNEFRLFVFRGAVSSQPELMAKSDSFSSCMHGYELLSEKKSFFLHCFHGGAIQAAVHTTVQFAIRNGRIRLIGEEYSYAENPEDERTRDEKSTNYLSGIRIETQWVKGRVKGQKKMVLSDDEKKPKYLEDFNGF